MRLDLMHFYKGALLYIFIALTACAQLGLVPPETFNQKWVYAVGSVTAVRVTAKDLHNEGRITTQEAINTQNKADNAREILDAARDAHNAGDLFTAEGKLATAKSGIKSLQEFLKSREEVKSP